MFAKAHRVVDAPRQQLPVITGEDSLEHARIFAGNPDIITFDDQGRAMRNGAPYRVFKDFSPFLPKDSKSVLFHEPYNCMDGPIKKMVDEIVRALDKSPDDIKIIFSGEEEKMKSFLATSATLHAAAIKVVPPSAKPKPDTAPRPRM